jgi:hypothetical protein
MAKAGRVAGKVTLQRVDGCSQRAAVFLELYRAAVL